MARAASAASRITVQELRGNVSVLMGAGGNIAVLPGRDGKLLVDPSYVGARPRISDALATINPDPIKHLINTHWHFDHTDRNEWLHNAGATILAHENTRKHLSAETRVEGWNFTFVAASAAALPTTVFQDEHTVHINRTTLTLRHYGTAHTDSDISVYFTDADILHTGDTFWNVSYPFIDYSTGGSIDGQISAAENVRFLHLKNVGDLTIWIIERLSKNIRCSFCRTDFLKEHQDGELQRFAAFGTQSRVGAGVDRF